MFYDFRREDKFLFNRIQTVTEVGSKRIEDFPEK